MGLGVLGQDPHHLSLVKEGPLFSWPMALPLAFCTPCPLREPHKAQSPPASAPSLCLSPVTRSRLVSGTCQFRAVVQCANIGVRHVQLHWDVPGQMLELLLNIFCYQVGTVTGFPSYGGCNNECGEHRSSPELSAQLTAAAQ